jgi:hypothetical protein
LSASMAATSTGDILFFSSLACNIGFKFVPPRTSHGY